MILDDDMTPGPWVDMEADFSRRIEAAEMPPTADRRRLMQLVERKGRVFMARPARLSQLLAEAGVQMTTDQVRKVLAAEHPVIK
ncbi:hypothetical protein Ade02nite_20410 [Paractinoplanes deccanensis]|uniref:Uncharacterized protein n=1 Tax=Paractinoplanes deccanensis TaxID=113561 RepID=A0ABQ3Y0B4_9ACTN|nr:hypothetical protein [Actinoplanes deccanensis]GID73400.1 hypothetical protein Ade02nite_20410 [Actinoplanes deccanensis]